MPAPNAVNDLIQLLTPLWPPPHTITYSTTPRLRPKSSDLTLAVLPTRSSPNVLVPTRPRRVASTSLRNYKSPMSRKSRVQGNVISSVARLGAARLIPGVITIRGRGEHPSLVGHLATHLGEDLHIGIALGPPRANRKPVLQLMRENGTAVAFVKVGLNTLTRSRVAAEYSALRHLASLDLGPLIVPDLVHIPPWEGAECLVTRPVRTWTGEGINPHSRARALRALVAAAPSDTFTLTSSPWWQDLALRLEDLPTDAGGRKLRKLGARIGQAAGGTALLHGAAHGDWSPWNLSTDRGKTVAWDWERFETKAPVGIDAIHFAVQEQIRLIRATPRAALEHVRSRAEALVEENGGTESAGECLFALYLLQLGERFIADGQRRAGSQRGPLDQWLIPSLETTISRLRG